MHFNQTPQNCVCSCGASAALKTLDATALNNPFDPETDHADQVSVTHSEVIYDSDEEPANSPRRDSITSKASKKGHNETEPKVKNMIPKGKSFWPWK